jgi:hypothetical protein
VARDWLLITVSTPRVGTSTLRVYAWRNLRSLGAHYLQQSVCLLPATPKTTRATAIDIPSISSGANRTRGSPPDTGDVWRS